MLAHCQASMKAALVGSPSVAGVTLPSEFLELVLLCSCLDSALSIALVSALCLLGLFSCLFGNAFWPHVSSYLSFQESLGPERTLSALGSAHTVLRTHIAQARSVVCCGGADAYWGPAVVFSGPLYRQAPTFHRNCAWDFECGSFPGLAVCGSILPCCWAATSAPSQPAITRSTTILYADFYSLCPFVFFLNFF